MKKGIQENRNSRNLARLIGFAIICLALLSVGKIFQAIPEKPAAKPFIRTKAEFIDEAGKDPSFREFREQLLIALQKKDLKFLMEHVDNGIRVSFDGPQGIEGFMKNWGLILEPEKSEIWIELPIILKLGSGFAENNKTAVGFPNDQSKYPDTIQDYQQTAIIATDVPVYSAPDPKSQVIDKLSWEIVRLQTFEMAPSATKNGMKIPWAKIEIYSGKIGYVDEKFVYNAWGLRGSFQNKNGIWKMTTLIAGD